MGIRIGIGGLEVGQKGSSYWNPLITGLTAVAISATRVDLSWANPDTKGDGVKVERSDDNGITYAVIATVALPTSTYSNTGLIADTISLYRVRAYKGTKYSAYSNIATGDLLSYGITAYWKLDEASGDAADSSGNGYTLTNVNTVTYVTGEKGNAASLGIGNTNKRLSIDNNFGLTYNSPRTITGRFQILSQPAANTNFVLFSLLFATNPGNYTTLIYKDQSGVKMLTLNGGAAKTYNITLVTGTWYHFAFSWDQVGNVIKLYMNSQLIITDTPFAADYHTLTTRFSIGDFADVFPASCIADDVMLFPRVLTLAGINASYKNNPDYIKGSLTSAAYCWFARPRALYNATANKTWIGIVYNDGSGYTNHILTIDNATGILTKFKVGAIYQFDDHCEPTILVRASDSKLFTCYSLHTDTVINFRTSTNALDASAWGAQSTINPVSPYTYTYPSCFQVVNGDIYIFYRVSTPTDTYWAFVKSTDGGATFGTNNYFYHKTYLNIKQNESNKDIIHFLGSNHPNEAKNPNTVVHFYFNASNGTWHKSDGTDVTANLPLEDANMTIIRSLAAPEQSWIEDIFIDSNGYPRVLMTYFPDEVSHFEHKYLYYSEWNGSAWSTPYQIHESLNRDISLSNAGGEISYPPLACFDRGNADRIFAAKDVSGVCEIFLLTRIAANSFTSVQKTFNNTFDQWRPFTVASPTRNVYWLNKVRYYSYMNDFDESLMNDTF